MRMQIIPNYRLTTNCVKKKIYFLIYVICITIYNTTGCSYRYKSQFVLSLSSGKDVIGLAETGSGKTGAFALPILQSLLASPQRLHTLVLTPTRELAFQISEQFEALGSSIGVKCGMWAPFCFCR